MLYALMSFDLTQLLTPSWAAVQSQVTTEQILGKLNVHEQSRIYSIHQYT